MNLHLDKDNFEGAIVATAAHFKIPEIFIEKDYWVTYALHQLFHSEVKDLIVFKGGTSLSKCYKIIERFSEDVDMVIVKNDTDTGNDLKRKLKAVTDVVDKSILEVVPNDPTTKKLGSLRKIVFSYPKVGMKGHFGEVRENITLEVSHLGNFAPNNIKPICTFIAGYIKTTSNLALIKQFGLEDFEVKTLAIERTFCEKIISLIRFSYTENPLQDLSNKVRHTYDLHQLLQVEEINTFVNSSKFDVLLLQVGIDNDKAIPNNKNWLYLHPKEAIIFRKTSMVWNELKKIYTSTFKELVTGSLPNENAVFETLVFLSNRIAKMEWNIKK
ncbi:nucleotidyl transferase AbiEii/AbiGii toxin family protein [Flavobacterium muglaense]|nr:nucleotidyl transferase AbiEii/AbiGii toxin family protein [Flavobacterium muglaense]